MNCNIPERNDKCKLKEIYTNFLPSYNETVRWCEYCGAVVVDHDYDGRTNPGSVREMEFPQLAKENKK